MLAGRTTLYRGLKMTQKDIDAYTPDQTMPLLGYTSTSKYFEIAQKFAFMDLVEESEKIPVILEIDFQG